MRKNIELNHEDPMDRWGIYACVLRPSTVLYDDRHKKVDSSRRITLAFASLAQALQNKLSVSLQFAEQAQRVASIARSTDGGGVVSIVAPTPLLSAVSSSPLNASSKATQIAVMRAGASPQVCAIGS